MNCLFYNCLLMRRAIKYFLFLSLILVFQNLEGQNRIKSLYDSAASNTYDTTIAFQYLDSVKLLTSDPELLLMADVMKGDLLNKNVAFESSKRILSKSFVRAVEIGSDSITAKTAFLISIPLFNEGFLDSSISYLKIAYLNSISAGDSLVQGMSLNNLGFVFETRGDLDSALMNYQKSAKVLNGLGHYDQASHAIMNMGYISQTQGNIDLAIEYFSDAIALAEIGKGDRVLVYTNLAIGDLYCQQGVEDSCFYYLKKAESYVGEENMPDLNVYIFSSLGHAYKQFEKYDQAKAYYQKSLAIFEPSGDSIGVMGIRGNLGEIAFMQARYDEAISELNSAKTTASQIGDKESFSEFNQKLANSYAELDNWKEAYRLMSETLEVQGELYSQQRLEALQELQTQYETEKKDNEIASLSQQAEIQQLKINQRNIQLIGAVIVLLLASIGGYAFYQQRKLKHQQAVSDMEQRMLRLQMNPHFIFNALASIQSYILQSDTKESVKYLAKFGKLMRQILEHSREESISIAEEADMLTNYIQIQQLRFQNRFDYEISVDEQIDQEETFIPPLFAQPFVENAIEHGLKDVERDGKITIRFIKENANIRLEIEDNGSGISTKVAATDHKSLATIISKERLEILGKRFHQKFSIAVENSTSATGVKATITLPVFS